MQKEINLKNQGLIKRLTNKTFKFDRRLADGFFTAEYFLKVRKIVEQNLPNQIVTMQWFQRKDEVMLCGIDEAVALIGTFAKNISNLQVYALNDGDIINAYEPVLKVTGAYEDFGFLENVIDAILARRSSVATNALRAINSANGKELFCMADRQDEILTQMGDGYACYVAGIRKVATDALGDWCDLKGSGTMPHALIQICGGDLLKACEFYANMFKDEKITALVDYNNDVINDSLIVARAFKDRLGAVRVDTSANLVDRYFNDKNTSGFDPRGVCKELIFALRQALDEEGFDYVKIVVSSGFTPEKISLFEASNVPVDVYGIGSYIVKNDTCGFTGDLVRLNGKDESKFGRKNIESDRLKIVSFN